MYARFVDEIVALKWQLLPDISSEDVCVTSCLDNVDRTRQESRNSG